MKIVHRTNAKEQGAAAHRRGGLNFRYLLDGDPDASDNYSLFIVEFSDEYSTPRHRHNFEQIRVMLEGSFSFGPGQIQKEGSVGYFAEGGYYTQQGVGSSRTLILQVGGPSGAGFMSHDILRKGGDELAKVGSFVDGVYTWRDVHGQKHNSDGYEAVWEHVHGCPVAYPEPRYADPVIMNPEAFSYLAVDGCPDVEMRNLGRFHERGLEIRQLKMATGSSYEFEALERGWLFFALSGEGRCCGEPWGAESAFSIQQGETVQIECAQDGEFYLFGLPAFNELANGPRPSDGHGRA
ncbi:hypothetical protein [Parasphingorhabdus sp.]|uniref:hypothetical protein n=1 Tax=Parasphingorhabdus sp. TaxID=2709688 RepID=UPI0032F013DD